MDRFNTNWCYNQPIVAPIVVSIVAPIKIKPVQSSLSYQQAIYQKDGGRGFNCLVGMGL